MKLYRGYQNRPKFLIPTLAREWQELNRMKKEYAAETTSLADLVTKMGEERLTRWAELAQIASPQFFTDQEVVAREFAGDKGFVIVLELDDEKAQEYYQGEQQMLRGDKLQYVSNFVFSGEELGRHLTDWRFDLLDLREQRLEGINPSKETRG